MIIATFALLLAHAAPEIKTAKIVEAALFKNGYAVVTREVQLDGSPETLIGEIPQYAYGTVWISSSTGSKVETVTNSEQDTTVMNPATTARELLANNVGKEITAVIYSMPELKGKLISVTDEALVVQTPDGMVIQNRGSVQRLIIHGEVVTSVPVHSSQRVLKVRSIGKGVLRITGLEYGLSWSPSYTIDILDDHRLSLTARCTVSNFLDDVVNAKVTLVTGFPNLPYLGTQDPLTAPNMQTAVSELASGGARREAMQAPAQMQMNRADVSVTPSMPVASEYQEGDLSLFEYPLKDLKKGERQFQYLFDMAADYDRVYTLDIDDAMTSEDRYQGVSREPLDVWNTLRFKNQAKTALTTAAVTIRRNNLLLGQGTVAYTGVTTESRVQMSKALDIRAQILEEETDRQRQKLNQTGYYFDLVTVKGTLRLSNGKNETAKMEISKIATGSVLDGGGGKVTKLARQLNSVNSQSILRWTATLKPGETKEIVYTYTVYVRV